MPFPYLRTNVHTQGQTQQTIQRMALHARHKWRDTQGQTQRKNSQLNSCTEKLCQQIFVYGVLSDPVSPARAAKRPPRASQPARRPALRQPSPEGGAAPERKQKPTKICWELPTIDQTQANRQKPKTYSQSQISKAVVTASFFFVPLRRRAGAHRALGLRRTRGGGHLALPQPLRAFGCTSFGGRGRSKRPRSHSASKPQGLRCANQFHTTLSPARKGFGGAGRDRTDDL